MKTIKGNKEIMAKFERMEKSMTEKKLKILELALQVYQMEEELNKAKGESKPRKPKM